MLRLDLTDGCQHMRYEIDWRLSSWDVRSELKRLREMGWFICPMR
jgi:hypothetical protein